MGDNRCGAESVEGETCSHGSGVRRGGQDDCKVERHGGPAKPEYSHTQRELEGHRGSLVSWLYSQYSAT